MSEAEKSEVKNPRAGGLPPAGYSHARGAQENPRNRFEKVTTVPDWEQLSEEDLAAPRRAPATYIPDHAKSIISTHDSPDLGFSRSLNPYRGCEHGCLYCFARPTHEYLGFSSGLDFETKIMVKERAPELLRAALENPRWEPGTLSMSTVTDCYQPAERRFGLTRRCLQVLAEFRNPVGLITKNALIARDVDLFREMVKWRGVAAMVSITSLDPDLARRMEPRTASPRQRLETVARLAEAGVPVHVSLAPVVPGLTDTEMPDIVAAAAKAGARSAHFTPVRLPYAVKDLFVSWLEREFPDRKERILQRIRDLRGGSGRLNDPNFGTRMTGVGIWAETFRGLFDLACRRAGFPTDDFELNAAEFRRPGPIQMSLPDLPI